MGKWNGKDHHNDGRTLEWGKDLTPGQIQALREGEVFTLIDEDEKPYSLVLMDSYDQIREGLIGGDVKWDTYKRLTLNGKKVLVDACIADFVKWLNDMGIHTISSRCGHGKGPTGILFEREGKVYEIREYSREEAT